MVVHGLGWHPPQPYRLEPDSGSRTCAWLSQPTELGMPPLVWAARGAEEEGRRTASERGCVATWHYCPATPRWHTCVQEAVGEQECWGLVLL